VIFDLDQTLWNGVLSEENVSLKKEFVHAILELDKKGILMSIVSKNSMEQANEKLEEFGIADYFIFPQINYKKKYLNVLLISRKIGISAEQMVFVDDDIYEIKEMNFYIPSMKAVTPEEFIISLKNKRYDVELITEETKNRRQYFLSEMKRIKDEKLYTSIEKSDEFNSRLKMKIFYRKFKIQDKERVNELISRTTKFNNIGEKNKNLKMDVLVYKDNYFEHGIVGVIGYEIKNSVMKLELVCISCRLYARGIIVAQLSRQKSKIFIMN